MSGSTGGGARIPPSPIVRPPSALLLPSWGVSEPVLAVETVAWVSTPFPFSIRQQADPDEHKQREEDGPCVWTLWEVSFISYFVIGEIRWSHRRHKGMAEDSLPNH